MQISCQAEKLAMKKKSCHKTRKPVGRKQMIAFSLSTLLNKPAAFHTVNP